MFPLKLGGGFSVDVLRIEIVKAKQLETGTVSTTKIEGEVYGNTIRNASGSRCSNGYC